MVLGLLAVVWIAVLAPPLLRRGAESRKADSVGDFRRHLGVLQRTGPSMIAPAHTRVERRSASAFSGPVSGYRPGATRPAARVPAGRGRTLRRRRNALAILAGSTFLFLVVGAMPRLHVVLAAAAVSLVLLVAYVALLVRLRNAAAEREMKLTFLPGPAVYEAGPLLRRSATN